MKYAFIEAHRAEFSVRAMCRVLRVHFSGFYAWLKEPLSPRVREDARQTELIRQAWKDSGKVYGYRKLTHDLRDQGERVSENRVARLASLAGIAAQLGYKRRPGRYGGKPAIVAENKLEQQFEVSQPDQVWVTDITYSAPRPGWSGVHMSGMQQNEKGGIERMPCPLLRGSMSRSGGDLSSTGRVT